MWRFCFNLIGGFGWRKESQFFQTRPTNLAPARKAISFRMVKKGKAFKPADYGKWVGERGHGFYPRDNIFPNPLNIAKDLLYIAEVLLT